MTPRRPRRVVPPLSGKAPEPEYFERRAVPEPNSGCWIWEGALSDGGYARMTHQGKNRNASRVSWLTHRGPIPAGMFVCHRCDNRTCVNPDHLFLGTNTDNMQDMARKGRTYSTLNPDIIRDIRRLRERGAPYKEIAFRYGLNWPNVRAIVGRKSWRHVN